MIVYLLKDGLGNQFFEYAYAKKMQESSKKEKIIFCTFMYKFKNFSLGGTRQCSLQHFNMPDDVKIAKGFTNFLLFAYFMLRLLFVYKKDFFNWFLLSKKIDRDSKYERDCKKGIYITSKPFLTPKVVSSKRKIKFIFGNYESVDSLPRDEVSLRKALQVKYEPQDKNKDVLQQIKNSNAVCVHIRRGDYLNKGNEWLQVCDYEYYKNAVNYAQQNIENPLFFVFSNSHDDIEWIKQNYKFDAKTVYVDNDNCDYEEFRLMCECKHFIISNSTFSWWSSFCSDADGKLVIAPKKWTNKKAEAKALFRKEFVKI